MEPDGVAESDLDVATRIAQRAGQLLLELRVEFGPVDPTDRSRRKQLKDEGDRISHEFIVGELSAARPADAILSEEGVDDHDRDDADRVWIVDPLDGTSEYSQGRGDCAVHIALWDRAAGSAERLVVGVVDLPVQGLTRTTGDLIGSAPAVPNDGPVRIVVSRSRPPEFIMEGAERLSRLLSEAGVSEHGVQILRVGSVGAKVNEVLSGRAEAYVHDTGFYEWDVAAPLAVAHHYGLVASHLDAASVTFNHRPPWVRDLIVCPPVLVPFLSP